MKETVKIHESEYGGGTKNFHVTKYGDELHVELTYPPRSDSENENGQVRYVFIDQESVRATDGVRLFYDYDRDGWVVQQGSKWEFDPDDEVMDEDWQEVAFIQSWAREKPEAELAPQT